MEQDRLSRFLPTIEQVIDRQPPIVTPETPLVDVLVRLGQVGGSCALLPALDSAVESLSMGEKQANYVLVKEGDRLVGIFTERDLVRLIAAGINLQQVRVAEVMTRELVTITLEEGKNLLAVLSLFRQHSIRHLPVVDDRGQLAGIITSETIRQALQPFNFLKWQQVSEVMVAQVIHGPPTASGLSLAQLMVEQGVSCVVIAQTDSPKAIFPLGIVTEGDILQYRALGLDLSQIQAQTIMSTPLFSVNPTDSLWLAHQEMQGRRVRRLGVRGKRGELLGIVTQTSLLQALAPVELFEVIETQQKMLEERTATLEAANRQLKQEIRFRQQAEELLREKEEHYRHLYENTPVMLHSIDRNGQLVSVNNYWLEKLGYERREVIGRKSSEFLTPDSCQYAEEVVLPAYFQTGFCQDIPYQMVKKDGEIMDVLLSAIAERDELGNIIRSLAVSIDITERKQAEESRRESEARFRLMADSAPVMIWMSGEDALCVFFNQTWLDFTGRSLAQEMGNGWAEGVHPDDLQGCLDTYLSAFNDRIPFQMEYRLRRADGEYRWVLNAGVPRFAPSGSFAGYIGSVIDITERQQAEAAMRQLNSELEQRVAQRTAQLEVANRALEEEIAKRKQAQEKLQHDVLHDGLTGLANRTLFLDHLQQAINRCQRQQDKLFAVLFLDLDRFGEINERFDHLVGDKLLVAVARRLEECQRAGDTVARFAGDEFVILLEDLATSEDASKVADRIHQVLKPPIVVDGHELLVTASIGIAIGGSQSPYKSNDQAERILRDADLAMFRAKARVKTLWSMLFFLVTGGNRKRRIK